MTTLPDVTALDLDLRAEWLTIWFSQPETRNALSESLTADLEATLECVRDDRSVRGITLRGRGGFFCAGGDLKAFKSAHRGGGSPEDIIEMSKAGAQLFDTVNSMPQVVVALIEGAALAGGFGVACCADVVICHTDARFGMTETTLGLSPAQIAPFVVRKLGYATARRLMLTAARFDGREAKELGFADFLGDSVEALESVEAQIRRQVLKCAPGAVAGTKALLRAIPELDRRGTIQAAAENFADRLLSDEGREGVASFLERRKPSWARDAD